MGSAIARGLDAAGHNVAVYNRSEERLGRLADVKAIARHTDLEAAFSDSKPSLVILALPLKPLEGLIDTVAALSSPGTIIASLSPMTPLAYLREHCPGMHAMRLMPNIGITKGESMTFICTDCPKTEADACVDLFKTMGDACLIPEDEMAAVTALASCGTAYALRYIRACMQAGVQMGLEPGDACRYTLQTLRGACALLEGGKIHPEAEIDKVCTPGGLTIKGLNTLDHNGFSSAVINAILASFKK